MKTYLLLPSSDYAATLLEVMATAMAGGYGGWLGCSLQPVVVSLAGEAAPSATRIEQIRADYEAARATLQAYAPSTPLLAMDAPMQMPPSDIGTALRAGDRLVVFCRLQSASRDLQLALQTRLVLARSGHDCPLTVVCELTERLLADKAAYDRLRHSLDFLRSVASVVFTGLRDDWSKTGFTLVQTAVALLDAVNAEAAGLPRPIAEKSGLAYTQVNLQSAAAVDALTRTLWLSLALTRTSDDDLSTWRDHLRLDAAGVQRLWTRDFPELQRLGQSLHHWLETVGSADFVLTADETVWRTICRELEPTKKLPKDFTLKAQRETALTSLLSAIDTACPASGAHTAGHYEAVAEDFLPVTDSTFRADAFADDLSPTVALEVAAWAFRPQLAANAYARTIRAAVLDLWELFFTGRDKLAQMSVAERAIATDSDEALRLGLTEAGRRQLAAGLVYDLAWEGAAATSSVDVGFALPPSDYERIKTSGEELATRSTAFQRFLYAYVKLHDGAFCGDFVSYIDRQTAGARSGMPAAELNVVATYPQFRQHVGLSWG